MAKDLELKLKKGPGETLTNTLLFSEQTANDNLMDFVVRAYVSQSKEGPSKEAMLERSRSIKSTLNTYNNKAPTPRMTKPNEPHNPYKPWTKPDEPNRFDQNSRRPDAHP